ARPATCQNTFLACAPPLKVTIAPLPTVRFCAIWKIQTSFAPPESVTALGIERPVPHLYSPGTNVIPWILPAPSSVAVGDVRPAASVYAFCMSRIAAVKFAGVG